MIHDIDWCRISCVCLRRFFTFYHGKSLLNHHGSLEINTADLCHVDPSKINGWNLNIDEGLEDDIPFQSGDFSGSMRVFWRRTFKDTDCNEIPFL